MLFFLLLLLLLLFFFLITQLLWHYVAADAAVSSGVYYGITALHLPICGVQTEQTHLLYVGLENKALCRLGKQSLLWVCFGPQNQTVCRFQA